MESQRNELLRLAEGEGWTASQVDNYGQSDWSVETWVLESSWSPVGKRVYLTFLIDPMDFPKNRPWALQLSLEPGATPPSKLLVSLKQWNKSKPDVVKFLTSIRNPAPIINITRDSVCAGDDADAPHERRIEVEPTLTDTTELIRRTALGYLASVNGIGHSWSAYLNGELIAVITADDIQPKVPTLRFGSENTLHFKYHSAVY